MSKLVQEFLKTMAIPHPGNRAKVQFGKAKDMTATEREVARTELLRLVAERAEKFRELDAPPAIMKTLTTYCKRELRILEQAGN